jgi:hypothetical protein
MSISCISLRLKGKWSIRQRQRFHSTPSVLITLCWYSIISPLWYNLHPYYLLVPMREKVKRALKTPFFAINAKGGESISPKQKDRTTMPISKNFETSLRYFKCSSIGIFEISIPLRNYISIDIYILKRSFSNICI